MGRDSSFNSDSEWSRRRVLGLPTKPRRGGGGGGSGGVVEDEEASGDAGVEADEGEGAGGTMGGKAVGLQRRKRVFIGNILEASRGLNY